MVAVGGSVDRFNPNALRASTGALFDLPIVECELDELIDYLDAASIRLLASSPAGTTPLWDADLTGPVAVAIGAEDEGLSPEITEAASSTVVIPMTGNVDSLNASVSLSLLAYEVVRQRT